MAASFQRTYVNLLSPEVDLITDSKCPDHQFESLRVSRRVVRPGMNVVPD